MKTDDWEGVRLYDIKIVLDAPYENYSKITRISKMVHNHSNYSVSCLINEALGISSPAFNVKFQVRIGYDGVDILLFLNSFDIFAESK